MTNAWSHITRARLGLRRRFITESIQPTSPSAWKPAGMRIERVSLCVCIPLHFCTSIIFIALLAPLTIHMPTGVATFFDHLLHLHGVNTTKKRNRERECRFLQVARTEISRLPIMRTERARSTMLPVGFVVALLGCGTFGCVQMRSDLSPSLLVSSLLLRSDINRRISRLNFISTIPSFLLSKHSSSKQHKKIPTIIMKFIILFAAVIAASLAAPLDDSKNAQILKYENDNIGIGGYNFA
jgi:hypothetical protein